MSMKINYKNYSRGTRSQQVDTNFVGGMLYTNVPLTEEFCKTLVNMDITKEGTIKSRQGLCITDTKPLPQNVKTGYSLLDATTASAYKSSVKDQHLVFTSNEDITPECLKNAKLIARNLRAVTKSGVELADTSVTTVPQIYGVKHSGYKMHDLEVAEPLENFVGCRAFNNDYYFTGPTGLKAYSYTESQYNEETGSYTYTTALKDIQPKNCSVTEATNRGYNMLSDNPYAFDSRFASTYLQAVNLTGLLTYKDAACTQLELTPQIGQTIYFKIIGDFKTDSSGLPYINGVNLTVNLEISINNGVSFYSLHNKTEMFSSSVIALQQRLIVPYTVQNSTNIILRATLTSTKITASDNATLVTSFDFSQKKDTESANYDLVTYTLKQSTGMCYWKERIILWGAPEDATLLFVSDVRDPSYFPYPNNVNVFDEPIIQAVPLLDNLVVFTSTKVYILGLDTDYEHLTQRCIQSNLQITPEDTHLTQVIKNMLFFKSGNYYYMIVPKANSFTGELTIAPISKNIEFLLDNFQEELYKILKMMYNYSEVKLEAIQLKSCYNYLDYEDVTNVYVFNTPSGELLNFCLLYNTIQRAWRIYIYGTPSNIYPVTKQSTEKSIYAMVDNEQYYNVAYSKESSSDSLAVTKPLFKNYQLYDSGYREQNVNLKKRYRELQFIINNIAQKKLLFGTGVFIDGHTRTALYDSEFVVKALNSTDTSYTPEYTGTKQHVELVLEHELANVTEVPGATILGTWELNSSVFPEQTVYKVRFPISGKGYSPRLLFINKDEQPYEILNTSYIYRQMSSR